MILIILTIIVGEGISNAINRVGGKQPTLFSSYSITYCGSKIADVVLDYDYCEASGIDNIVLNELKSIIIALGRFVNDQKNNIDLKLYQYDIFWSELYEAFDF